MKARLLFLGAACLVISACVAPPTSAPTSRYPAKPGSYSNRIGAPVSSDSMNGTSAANPPIQPGETSTAYRRRLARQQQEAVPTGQFMYQNNYQDAFGRRTDSGVYRSTGGVTEDVYIGNQQIPVVPGQPYYGPAPAYPNVYQGGYVAPGTNAVVDPYSGRVLPVQR
ncbi:hypothetical protein [Brevifollis gellanilyticus]|uniref:Lipoprotein n=1 Tax=Brevifollis gellanilyticus TaxID=748831 RepID=A0A512MIE6_9BACT|nr:hypothetical protein [Brevifollis gellanilyticus]GEP46081.1 hypothetical protein BGE01nite_53720 [Brevifollis gellanilyticus]